MRIIAGKLKGRKIETVPNSSYRPTTGMLKEAIFSILSSGKFVDAETGKTVLDGATIIDVFGGTGSLSFEAISRGAAKAIIIEKDQNSVSLLRENASHLGVKDQVNIIKGDALLLPMARLKVQIAFIDPPFNQGLVDESVRSLVQKAWLEEGALMVIRTHPNDKYDIKNFAEEVFSRKYGKSLLAIYRYSNKSNG